MSLSYQMAEAWRGIRRAPGVTVASVLSLFAAWMVLALSAEAMWNGWRFVNAAQARKEVVVLMRDRTGPEADSVLAARLQGLQEVAAVNFVSPDSAWAQLSRDMQSDPDLLEAVGANPLPASFRISLRPGFRTPAQIEHLAQTVRQYPEVSEVVYGGEWLAPLEAWLQRLTWVGLAFAAGVSIGVVVLVMLTIRLALLARRDVLRVVRLLGADEGFVRMPFILEGLILTIVSSGAALLFVELASGLFAHWWSDWRHMPWTLNAGFLAFALALGLIGSLVGAAQVGRMERA